MALIIVKEKTLLSQFFHKCLVKGMSALSKLTESSVFCSTGYMNNSQFGCLKKLDSSVYRAPQRYTFAMGKRVRTTTENRFTL